MKKIMKLNLITIVIIMLITSSSFAEQMTYVGIQVGEEYDYEFGRTYFYALQNDTTYMQESNFNLNGKEVNVRVDAIYEQKEGFLIPISGIAVNTTETFEGKQYKGETYLDYWYTLFLLFELGFEQQIVNFNPEEYEFNPPEPLNESEPPYAAFNLPIFASTNVSFYEDLEANIGSVMPVYKQMGKEDKKLKLSFKSYEVAYWEDKEEFYLNVTMDGEFSDYVNWTIAGVFNYIIHIDTYIGVVKDLKFLYRYELVLEENLTIAEIAFDIARKGLGNTVRIHFPWIETLVFSIVMILLVKKKREKRIISNLFPFL